MSDGADKVVNLRRARKAKARNDARREADGNAARFGRSRTEREADAARAALEVRRLDGHERE